MSATNRGKRRNKNDLYPTDPRLTAYLLRRAGHRLPPGAWWEPCVGPGGIVRAVEAWRPGVQRWSVCDIDPRWQEGCADLLFGGRIVEHATADYCGGAAGAFHRPQVIVTNPAFTIAEDIIRESMRYVYADGKMTGTLVLLLRLNFLGSVERVPLWREFPQPDVYPLAPRPSFGLNRHGKPGTDACEYGWWVWDKDSIGRTFHVDQPWRAPTRRRKHHAAGALTLPGVV